MLVAKENLSGALTMASHSKRQSYVQYLQVMGTDATFVVISKSVCAADWEQDPWTGYQGFTTLNHSWWVLAAIDLQNAGVSNRGNPCSLRKTPV